MKFSPCDSVRRRRDAAAFGMQQFAVELVATPLDLDGLVGRGGALPLIQISRRVAR